MQNSGKQQVKQVDLRGGDDGHLLLARRLEKRR